MPGEHSPSDWVTRWTPPPDPGSTALDLACGSGRHLRWLAQQGWRVTGVDRDATALAALQGVGELVVADLEGAPWPLGERVFDLVVVTHYLWRPLLPFITAAVAPGGRLIYETFAQGHEHLGRPRRPEFLLQPGELVEAVAPLRLLAYEAGRLEAPPRWVQRAVAARPRPTDVDPVAHWCLPQAPRALG